MSRAGGEHGRPDEGDDSGTGLPGLRTWRSVYAFVLAVFVLWIVTLTILTRSMS